MATNLHGQVPQILFIAQLTLSPPAFYVYRCLDELSAGGPFFIAWCSLVVVSSPAFYVYRTSSAVWVPLFLRYSAFLCLIIFFICPVSLVCPFLPLPFASGLRSEKRLFFPLSHSLRCSLLFRSPVHALRYKRYTFLRPRFEGFSPSPARLAAILAWLSSYIVRLYYLSPF